jgi:hypothetical protein
MQQSEENQGMMNYGNSESAHDHQNVARQPATQEEREGPLHKRKERR